MNLQYDQQTEAQGTSIDRAKILGAEYQKVCCETVS